VIIELVDLRVHALEPEYLVKLTERDELHQRTGDEDQTGAAEHDGADGDAAQQRTLDRVHLAIPDRIDGDDDHIDGVAQTPTGEATVSDGREHHDREREADAEDQVAERRAEQAGWMSRIRTMRQRCHRRLGDR